MTGQDNPGQRTVVIGVGNEFRRDDGAGPEVIARLRALQPGDASLSGVTLALSDGEPGRLIDLWAGARLAVVVDAVRDTAVPPGHGSSLRPALWPARPTARPARTASASATPWSWPGCSGACPPGSRSSRSPAATSASAPA